MLRERLERQLGEAQALAQVGSWEWDLRTGHVTWSDEHYRIYGLPPGVPVDLETAKHCVHPADRPAVERLIQQAMKDGQPYSCEFRVVRPDGTERVVEAHARVERDTSGLPIRKVGTSQDITERKRIADALHLAEARYRALVEHAVEGIFRTTPDGRFLMANQALARMLGYDTPEQLIAERPDLARDHYVHPEERARFRRLVEAQGLVHGFEYEAYRRDGTSIWLRAHARVAHDLDGTICYEGTVEDITNRRSAEQLLDLRARQQAAVARFGEAAIAGHDLASLLQRASALVADTLEVEYSQVLELRPDGDYLCRAGTGWRPGVIGSVVPGVGSERPVVIDDWRAQPDTQMPPHLRDHGVLSGITVIIGTPEHPFGVLGAHAAARRAFTIHDVNFLQGIASILAAVVVRLRGEEARDHLLARAISAQEEERTRVARELHDETGQALSAILVGLRTVQEANTLDQVRVLVQRLRHLTSQTMRDVGRLARGLRPTTLDDLGLVPALQRYGDELSAARGIDITITDDGKGRLPTEIETTLYRIIQEALTNVARHAGASHARVTIERGPAIVRAAIRDDGAGFNEIEAGRALGLTGMQERASLLGGTVDIVSHPGTGATVTVDLPLRNGGH
jgi:PAS domain S-box-containing protein